MSIYTITTTYATWGSEHNANIHNHHHIRHLRQWTQCQYTQSPPRTPPEAVNIMSICYTQSPPRTPPEAVNIMSIYTITTTYATWGSEHNVNIHNHHHIRHLRQWTQCQYTQSPPRTPPEAVNTMPIYTITTTYATWGSEHNVNIHNHHHVCHLRQWTQCQYTQSPPRTPPEAVNTMSICYTQSPPRTPPEAVNTMSIYTITTTYATWGSEHNIQ